MTKVMVIIVSFIFLSFNSYSLKAVFSEQGSGGSFCCKATGFLGLNECVVQTCPSGQCCYCEGGFFTPKCGCRECVLPGTAPRSITNLTPKQRTDALDFIQWCSGQTGNIANLGTIVSNILSAINQNDQNQYDYWETQFRNAFVTMSTEEQQTCNNWAIEKGY